MKTLGVYTQDFSLYHDVIKELRKRKLHYIALDKPTNMPYSIKVVLTTQREKTLIKRKKTIVLDQEKSISQAVDKALNLLNGKDVYTHLSIGIDPGEHPGIAVIGDGILLHSKHLNTPKDILKELTALLKLYQAEESVIRIGHGSPLIRNRIINALIALHIPIEIVDETRSNPPEHFNRHTRDEAAAAKIALIRGGKVTSSQPLSPTRGAIRNIQRKSRTLSQGSISIDTETAKRVLKGELSLHEAVENNTNKTCKKTDKPKRL